MQYNKIVDTNQNESKIFSKAVQRAETTHLDGGFELLYDVEDVQYLDINNNIVSAHTTLFSFSPVFIYNASLLYGCVVSCKVSVFSKFEYLYLSVVDESNDFYFRRKRSISRRLKNKTYNNMINNRNVSLAKDLANLMHTNGCEGWEWYMITIIEDISENDLKKRMNLLGERLFGKRKGSLRFFWVRETDTKNGGIHKHYHITVLLPSNLALEAFLNDNRGLGMYYKQPSGESSPLRISWYMTKSVNTFSYDTKNPTIKTFINRFVGADGFLNEIKKDWEYLGIKLIKTKEPVIDFSTGEVKELKKIRFRRLTEAYIERAVNKELLKRVSKKYVSNIRNINCNQTIIRFKKQKSV